jgi:2-polyprenyl-3-methyl-5-hydroxy-6-metoxy-1,4-benzoquinol methylase
MGDTRGEDYADRLASLQGRRWKSLLGVQLPYRWNVRRLLAGRARVLDVGCGVGRNLAHLGRGVGVDHNAAAVATARAAGQRAWTTAEWPDCPDAIPGHYDGMLLAHVLEHLDGPTADDVVASYLPYLTANARLVLICPQERGYATDDTHVRFLDIDAMSAAAQSWGFTPARGFSFPLPHLAGKSFTYNEFVVVADRAT